MKKLRPDTPMPLDELLESLNGASASETIAVLFELELMGLVRPNELPDMKPLEVDLGAFDALLPGMLAEAI